MRIWGLDKPRRKQNPAAYQKLLAAVGRSDAEVRAQAAKVLGDGHVAGRFRRTGEIVERSEARPKFFAAIALGHLGREEAVKPLLAMLKEQ